MQFQLLALSAFVASAFSAPVELSKRTDPPQWGLALTRECTEVKICNYHFGIKVDKADPIKCTIVDMADPATTHQWFAKKCAETSAWELSWGWDYPSNFVVATLVYHPNNTRAFYGYNEPNRGLPTIVYDDQTPRTPEHF